MWKIKNYWKLRSSKHFILFLLFILSYECTLGQVKFPQGYFMFPIKPGEANLLSGEMGELRANHFHGGIDIKTDGKIGYSTYASADGFVSRIKVSSFGYGNVVYITHPNGFVTVYAHLDKFKKEIADYVIQKQYEQEQFEVELNPSKNELPVKKGEVIGLAGNSGSSGGPHLHYEIRDLNDKLFHPLLFGFNEVKDTIPPTIDKIAIRTMDIDSRVNNAFGRLELKAIKKGDVFQVPSVITVYGTIGLEVKSFDKANNNYNHYGIASYKIFLDNKEVFSHDITSYTFDENKYINTHIDYETYIQKGQRFEKCYISDGDKLSTYKTDVNKGKITIKDEEVHEVRIMVSDVFNNQSTLIIKMQGASPKTKLLTGSGMKSPIESQLFENILKVSARVPENISSKVYSKGNIATYMPVYSQPGINTYLYDMRKGLPDSIAIGSLIKRFNYVRMIPSNVDHSFTFKKVEFNIPSGALFDTLYLEGDCIIGNDSSEMVCFNSQSEVFFEPINMSWGPGFFSKYKGKPLLYSLTAGDKLDDFIGGEWESNKIKFKTRNLGKFTLGQDTVCPLIKYLNFIGNSIRFNISDNSSGIDSIKATLNGNWILMNYDHKKHLIWSERLDKTIPLKGDFKLEVKDKAGNKNIFSIQL
jgi:murein DD-endopeptidase MepM/ murein hydrolase activator NlpD